MVSGNSGRTEDLSEVQESKMEGEEETMSLLCIFGLHTVRFDGKDMSCTGCKKVDPDWIKALTITVGKRRALKELDRISKTKGVF